MWQSENQRLDMYMYMKDLGAQGVKWQYKKNHFRVESSGETSEDPYPPWVSGQLSESASRNENALATDSPRFAFFRPGRHPLLEPL